MTGLSVVGEAVRSIVPEATEGDGVNVTLFVWKEDATFHSMIPPPSRRYWSAGALEPLVMEWHRAETPSGSVEIDWTRTATPLIPWLSPITGSVGRFRTAVATNGQA